MQGRLYMYLLNLPTAYICNWQVKSWILMLLAKVRCYANINKSWHLIKLCARDLCLVSVIKCLRASRNLNILLVVLTGDSQMHISWLERELHHVLFTLSLFLCFYSTVEMKMFPWIGLRIMRWDINNVAYFPIITRCCLWPFRWNRRFRSNSDKTCLIFDVYIMCVVMYGN